MRTTFCAVVLSIGLQCCGQLWLPSIDFFRTQLIDSMYIKHVASGQCDTLLDQIHRFDKERNTIQSTYAGLTGQMSEVETTSEEEIAWEKLILKQLKPLSEVIPISFFEWIHSNDSIWIHRDSLFHISSIRTQKPYSIPRNIAMHTFHYEDGTISDSSFVIHEAHSKQWVETSKFHYNIGSRLVYIEKTSFHDNSIVEYYLFYDVNQFPIGTRSFVDGKCMGDDVYEYFFRR